MSRIANFRRGIGALLYNSARWHIKHYSTGGFFPLAATFQLTNKCNLRCIMCNIPNNPRQAVLPLGVFTGIVEELSSLGCCFVSLSGGEVLTINNFLDYLRSAKAKIPSVNMVTNGLLLDKETIKEIANLKVDSISLSLDGMERSHEFIRNKEGAFSITVNAIKELKRHAPQMKIVINTVITPWNLDELVPLTEFVEGLGVMHKFQPLNEHPHFDGQAKSYSIENEKRFDDVKLNAVIEFLLKRKNVANSSYFLKSIPAYFSKENRYGLFEDRCMLPRFLCEFREDAMMYPCLGGTGWREGYPVSKGIRNILKSLEYRSTVKRLESCRACQKSYSVCYIEPRVAFPVTNFFKYKLLSNFI